MGPKWPKLASLAKPADTAFSFVNECIALKSHVFQNVFSNSLCPIIDVNKLSELCTRKRITAYFFYENNRKANAQIICTDKAGLEPNYGW